MTDMKRIKLWMFDMDHCLYPPGTGFPSGGVPEFMEIFVAYTAKAHGLTPEEVHQKIEALRALSEDPTALLKKEIGFNQRAWDTYACEVRDYNVVQPSPEAQKMLSELDGVKVVVTNAGQMHAEKMLKHLGVFHLFDHVSHLDNRAMASKPDPQVYQEMLDTYGVEAADAIMVDDLSGHLKSAHELGMQTALVYTPQPESATHITYAAATLEEFLRRATNA